MAYDGLVANSICKELIKLQGYKVDKVTQPLKDTIILGLYKNANHKNLLCCISSSNNRVHLTNHNFKNPAVAPNFCMLLRKHLIGYCIKNVYIKNLERIFYFEFENYDNPNKILKKTLIVELMGKHCNLILTDENNIIIDSLRHTSTFNNSLRDIYPSCLYNEPVNKKLNFLNIKSQEEFYNIIENSLTDKIAQKFNTNINLETSNINDFELDKIISSKFIGISYQTVLGILDSYKKSQLSKDLIFNIYNDLLTLTTSSSDNLIFKNIIIKNKSDYFLTNVQNLSQESFKLNLFLDNFYFEKENNEIFSQKKKNLLNSVSSKLKTENKKLENITKKLSECNDMDKYRIYGELLTANLYKYNSQNLSEIEVENYYTNSLVKIPLDIKYSVNYNAKLYFKKYTKLKRSIDILNSQKNECLEQISYLESILYEINSVNVINDLLFIESEISENLSNKFEKNSKNKKKTSKKEVFSPIEFEFNGYKILVGKNNKENDYLTTKVAQKNDIWFHVKDMPGSHVILKVENDKLVDEDAIYEAAKLAAKHSKAKNSSNVPIDYCNACYVKKPNGSKPGFVIYKNNKTIFVKL